MATWPVTLPAFTELQNYHETPPDQLIASQPSFGPPKVRRRFTAAVRIITGQLILTLAQVEILDSFFLNDLAGGSDTLTSTHPRTAVAISAYLANPDYRQHPKGVKFMADIKLTVLP